MSDPLLSLNPSPTTEDVPALPDMSESTKSEWAATLKKFALGPEDWEVLLNNIEDGRCTPFLGAGASVPTLPLGSQLADQWAKRFNYPLKDRDLSKIAQYVAVTRRDGLYPKSILAKWFEERSSPDFNSAHQIHRLLAEFPLPVYVTTNYDDFMWEALQSADKKGARRDICRWNDDLRFKADELGLPPAVFDENPPYEPDAQNPIVFHLHGHKDHPESLVLTEDDYVDFLIAISKNEELLPPRITRAFSRSTLLFVGYSLADWNFRLLFRKLVTYIQQGSNKKRAHLSVQVEPFAGNDEVSLPQRISAIEYLNQYYSELNIRVFWGDCEAFTRVLRKKWEERNASPLPAIPKIT